MKYAAIITATGRKGYRGLSSALRRRVPRRHPRVVLHPFVSFLSLFTPRRALFFLSALIRVKSPGGRIVRGIWSVFDAERARLATERGGGGEAEGGERHSSVAVAETARGSWNIRKKNKRKARWAIPRRRGKSRFHFSTRPVSRMPAACVYFVSFYITEVPRETSILCVLSPAPRLRQRPSLSPLLSRGLSAFLAGQSIVKLCRFSSFRLFVSARPTSFLATFLIGWHEWHGVFPASGLSFYRPVHRQNFKHVAQFRKVSHVRVNAAKYTHARTHTCARNARAVARYRRNENIRERPVHFLRLCRALWYVSFQLSCPAFPSKLKRVLAKTSSVYKRVRSLHFPLSLPTLCPSKQREGTKRAGDKSRQTARERKIPGEKTIPPSWCIFRTTIDEIAETIGRWLVDVWWRRSRGTVSIVVARACTNTSHRVPQPKIQNIHPSASPSSSSLCL